MHSSNKLLVVFIDCQAEPALVPYQLITSVMKPLSQLFIIL